MPAPDAPADAFERKLWYRDPLTFPRVDREALLGSQRDTIWVQREVGSHANQYRPPLFHDQAKAGGLMDLSFKMDWPRAAVFVQSRRNVLLAGGRGLIGKDGSYCTDESVPIQHLAEGKIANYGAPGAHNHEYMGFRRTDEIGRYLLTPREARDVAGPVAVMTSRESINFGAFIFCCLSKLVGIESLGELPSDLKFMVPQHSHRFAQFFEAAGIEKERIIDHDTLNLNYRLAHAIVPSMRNRDMWLDDESLALFDRLRSAHGHPSSGRKIFVSRLGITWQTRKMVNENEVIAALVQRGFDVVRPEDLSAIEQIRTFSEASFVVGGAGSGMFNSVFCSPGTKLIDIESEGGWVQGHVALFSSRGLRYGVFEGTALEAKEHSPFVVDVEKLMQRVDAFDAG